MNGNGNGQTYFYGIGSGLWLFVRLAFVGSLGFAAFRFVSVLLAF